MDTVPSVAHPILLSIGANILNYCMISNFFNEIITGGTPIPA